MGGRGGLRPSCSRRGPTPPPPRPANLPMVERTIRKPVRVLSRWLPAAVRLAGATAPLLHASPQVPGGPAAPLPGRVAGLCWTRWTRGRARIPRRAAAAAPGRALARPCRASWTRSRGCDARSPGLPMLGRTPRTGKRLPVRFPRRSGKLPRVVLVSGVLVGGLRGTVRWIISSRLIWIFSAVPEGGFTPPFLAKAAAWATPGATFVAAAKVCGWFAPPAVAFAASARALCTAETGETFATGERRGSVLLDILLWPAESARDFEMVCRTPRRPRPPP